MNYDDKESFELYGVHYKSTPSETNELCYAVTKMAESKRYESLKRTMEQVRISPELHSTALRDVEVITDEIVDLEVKLMGIVMKKAQQMGIEV